MCDLPKTMQAAILVEQRQPLVIDRVELPTAVTYGQVLVKVCYSGICGSQIGEIDGVKGKDPYLPHLLGHEGSGVVMKVGQGVTHVHPGDHVVMHWMPGKGIQPKPPVYARNGRPVNAGFVTTFNEYAIVSENRLTPIPDDFPLDLAPLFGCAVTTAFGIVNNKANIKIGQSVVVFGAGGVGLSVIQAAAMVSANPIIAVDLFDEKLEFSKKVGATHTVNAKKTEAAGWIRGILNGIGADAVIENTGDPNVISMAYQLTGSTGKTILVGVPKVGSQVSLYTLPLHFGKLITGTRGGECLPHQDIPRYIKLMRAGKLDLQKLVTDRFKLSEINTAIENMRAGEITGRCLIEIGSPGGNV
jgi:S-(hydroxymethyl)glutathione dehydrogenase/alcohol dehydrogenase